ncbi:MAG TPA: Sec-independent protein translocase protein TatB [Woeseiaceae bacterium]|nr:Sec-independent protein translocase protein TatB [Woeseiaceae bacterium]
MSGVGFSELLILCLIGLIVLGPKRLPQVANQIGTWIGQARRMTRVMKRQLEEELDLNKPLHVRPTIHTTPNDDDTFSPLHDKPVTADVAADIPDATDAADVAGEEPIAADSSAPQEPLSEIDVEHTRQT